MVLALAALLLLAGCSEDKKQNAENPQVKPTIGNPKFSKETFPKIDGSTATIPLSEALASSLLSMSKDEATKFIKHNTTHNAYVNLIDDKVEIIFVTEPSEEELKLAKDANIELEVIPVVKEAFVFLVNSKNPIKSLSTKQIQDIYQGKINNWKEVGGSDTEIIAYQRTPNSGSQTLMEQQVMKGLKMMDAPKNVVPDMAGIIDTVANYDNSDKALGYSVYYYANSMYNKNNIKLIAVDGIEPNNTSISTDKYPFTSAYYAVVKKSTPQDSSSRKLLNWLLSGEGQKVAEAAGYVPMKLR